MIFGVGEVHLLSRLVSIINGLEMDTHYKTLLSPCTAAAVDCSTVSKRTTNSDSICITILRVGLI